MNNVLLVGNGFDLAHGLKTNYKDFLFMLKGWKHFHGSFVRAKQGTKYNEGFDFYYLLKNIERVNEDYIKALNDIIKENSWVKYYCNCEAEIDGWIDFEREIYPVIELFQFVFKADYYTLGHGGRLGEAHISKSKFSPKLLRIARLWDKYFDAAGTDTVMVKEPYASVQYGILKKTILKELRKEFDEFIYAFEIYLHEFVFKNDDIKPLEQITKLNISSVISFNYTLTEKLYGIDEDDVHHLHGMIREDLESENNNMVMGVSEAAEQNMDFIYFVKYFQRIKKSSGTKYKELMEKEYRTQRGFTGNAYKLYIYGHSLDETDKDIITYAIGTKEELARGEMRPKHVTIYYYDETDYEQKVINLIKLYGRNIVEAYMEAGQVEFIETSSVTS